jgi:hypothetical protein
VNYIIWTVIRSELIVFDFHTGGRLERQESNGQK